MPKYDYPCDKCGKKFAIVSSISEIDAMPTVECPHCQSDRVKKQITGFFTKTSKKSSSLLSSFNPHSCYTEFITTNNKYQ